MSQAILNAANDYTGIDPDVAVVFTAGSNGSFVQRIRFKAAGSNVATVARIYINNGADKTVAANNALYSELSLPVTTAIATAAVSDIDYPLNLALPAGFRITVGLGTAVGGGWVPVVIGGNY
jgi:hypothetical protein